MDDYLARFKAMVEELRAHPDVVVTHFWTGEAARERLLLRAEDFLQQDLNPTIRNFFQTANGMQLRWMHRSDPRYEDGQNALESNIQFEWDAVRKAEFGASGMVNILPIEDIFSDDMLWMGTIWFENGDEGLTERLMGTTFPKLEIRKAIRPVDFYSEYSNVAFVFQPKSKNPWMTQGSDHHGVYDSNSFFHFEDYMEFVLRTKGIVSLRDKLPWNRETKPSFLESLSHIEGLAIDQLDKFDFQND
jgi:hypothetical protein